MSEREARDQLAAPGLGAGALHEVHEPITARQETAGATDAIAVRRHSLGVTDGEPKIPTPFAGSE